ncbi:copia [Lasius niger]|uniref:Copia n=1 Tax=Lasius niger TaxID=67767 RepID=A0A0J7N792_LASNI|nr:copia [Lasius niger]
MSTSDSVVTHITKVQNLASQIADVGKKLSEVTIMAKILGSLTSKYNAFQTAWDSVEPERQTMANLQERLLKEEAKLSAESDSNSALYSAKQEKNVANKAKPKEKEHSRRNVECFKCKRKGHFARDCRSKQHEKEHVNKDGNRDCAFVVETIKTKKDKDSIVPFGYMRKLLDTDLSNVCEANVSTAKFQLWHERLGHVNKKTLANMAKADLMIDLPAKVDEDFFCESCQAGKSHRLPFSKRSELRTTKPEKKPSLSHMKVFGSDAFMYIPKQFTSKLDARAKKVILVGYQGDFSNYRLYDPETKKVSVSRNVIFHENSSPSVPLTKPAEETVVLLRIEEEQPVEQPAVEENEEQEDEEFVEADEEPEEQQVQVATERRLRAQDSIKRPSKYLMYIAEYNLPCSFQEAINSEQSEKWKQAMKEEFHAHNANQT